MGIEISTAIAISPITDLNNQGAGGAPPTANALLLETGDFLLLETGDKILLES